MAKQNLVEFQVTSDGGDGDATMKIKGDPKTYRRWGFMKPSLMLEISTPKVTRSYETEVAEGRQFAYIIGKGMLEETRVGIAGSSLRPLREVSVNLQRLHDAPETIPHHWRANGCINIADGEFIHETTAWVQGYVPAGVFDEVAESIRRGDIRALTARFELDMWSENLPDHYYFAPGKDGDVERPAMASGKLVSLRWEEASELQPSTALAPPELIETFTPEPEIAVPHRGDAALVAAISRLYPPLAAAAAALCFLAGVAIFK